MYFPVHKKIKLFYIFSTLIYFSLVTMLLNAQFFLFFFLWYQPFSFSLSLSLPSARFALDFPLSQGKENMVVRTASKLNLTSEQEHLAILGDCGPTTAQKKKKNAFCAGKKLRNKRWKRLSRASQFCLIISTTTL